MNNNKKGLLQKMTAFAEDRGFYIILALCALVIGVSGYVLFFTGSDVADLPEPQVPVVSSNEPQEPSTTVPKISVEMEPDTEPIIEDAPVLPEEKPVSKPVEVKQPAVPKAKDYIAPVPGKVTREFSGEKLVYDDTMDDYRVHNGTDFEVAEGERIACINDGKVIAVFYDELNGNCVSVEHADKIVSTYCGLGKNATMKVGMKIKNGDAVGEAGGGIKCESAQPLHLHLTVTKSGKPIDFAGLAK